MKIGMYRYVERNGIFREEFIEDKADDPDGCCTLHYLLTNKGDFWCDLYERHEKGGLLMNMCGNCKHFIPQ